MQAILRFLGLLIWVVFGSWGACHAAPSITTDNHNTHDPFASWLDATGTATLATVQKQDNWEPFSDWKSWAYGPEPVWLRVQIPGTTATDAPPWILVVRPAFLDRVTFYDPTMGVERYSGDFLPANDDALGSVLFSFEAKALPAARQVYVKVESASARVVHLSLMPRAQAQAYTRHVEWTMGASLLLSVVFLIWAVTRWLQTNDRMMGFFALKQLMISLWGFFFLGFARITIGDWFAEGTLSKISILVAVNGMVSTILWFYAALLAEYKARAWMLAALNVAGWTIQALGLLNFVDQTQLSLQIVNTTAPLLLLWIVLTLWRAKPKGTPPPIPKAALLAYLVVYAVLNSLPSLMYLKVIPESPFLFVGNMSLLVADGLVMLVILNIRQRRFKEQHQAISTQLMLQQEQARLDQQYLDEQRKLLAMLAHEMKTPLANLRIWMEAGPKGRPVMTRAIHDMNRVIERCVHAGQLSDHSLQPRNEWLDAAELTQSVLSNSRQPGRVQLKLPAEVYAVYTDAQMLSIVLSNVLENAYKYSAPETPIELELATSAGPNGISGWCWRVENTVGAAGFPDADKVFDKYYRSPHAQRQSGSGLGLFLVKSLLDLMHGQVIYTPLAYRVRFEVWLPNETTDSQANA
jgi:signal transduction histidine kinase